jgi:hypothetical protein
MQTGRFWISLFCSLACAGVARAQSHDAILGCVRGVAAANGVDPSSQLAVLAHDCPAPCAGLAALPGLSPTQQAAAFVKGCCPPEATSALAAGDWQKVSRACGVPVQNESFASLEWVAFGKINQWLQTQAASADVFIRNAAAEVFATSRSGLGLALPMAASWKGHYQLASSKHGEPILGVSYVFLDGGKLYVGRQPTVHFDAKAYVTPQFPDRELGLSDLRRAADALLVAVEGAAGKRGAPVAKPACMPPLVIADASAKAAQLEDVVRVFDCGVRVAVATKGVIAAHLVPIRRHTASDDKPAVKDPDAPAWIKAAEHRRVTLAGSMADVVKVLDDLYAAKVSTALID